MLDSNQQTVTLTVFRATYCANGEYLWWRVRDSNPKAISDQLFSRQSDYQLSQLSIKTYSTYQHFHTDTPVARSPAARFPHPSPSRMYGRGNRTRTYVVLRRWFWRPVLSPLSDTPMYKSFCGEYAPLRANSQTQVIVLRQTITTKTAHNIIYNAAVVLRLTLKQCW